jgi:hypothetical protein
MTANRERVLRETREYPCDLLRCEVLPRGEQRIWGCCLDHTLLRSAFPN